MPVTSVPLSPAVSVPSSVVQEVIESISSKSGALARAVTSTGGVEVSKLREVLATVAECSGLVPLTGDTFAAGEIAWESGAKGLAMAIQGGRAASNNGVLVSVLAAAARPEIDWLVVVLPERYKNGSTFASVLKQLRALQGADGIRLQLAGVTLIGF